MKTMVDLRVAGASPDPPPGSLKLLDSIALTALLWGKIVFYCQSTNRMSIVSYEKKMFL